ncbi:hypothetical protein Vadar_021145 [Vaccinium darrowii]|uniref:Uncharacterized protein n=1 Tax=Vaccinium darrowii TaxID=229202 RepID=A0ACB7YQG7_9ERIC|nr:hypothetical protein Vadar_021145 [Vaccinium darrowii]
MAPRGRPRKRLTRMDAAVDAMIPLGFSEKLVSAKIKRLLKEYGGDDGWPFIEADAYKLLIDTILDDQEDADAGEERNEEEVPLLNGTLGDERPGDSSAVNVPGPSMLSLPPISSGAVGAAAQTIETGGGYLLIAGGDREGGDGSEDAMELDAVSKGGDGSGVDNRALQSPPSVILTPPAVDGLQRRRRKPCYGWISSGDEEEDDFIQLTPAPRLKPAKPPGQMENGVGVMGKRRKWKSMWDVGP